MAKLVLFVLISLVWQAESRVFCSDRNSNPWSTTGYSCPLKCANVIAAVENLVQYDFESFLEVGPGKNLTVARLDSSAEIINTNLRKFIEYGKVLRRKEVLKYIQNHATVLQAVKNGSCAKLLFDKRNRKARECNTPAIEGEEPGIEGNRPAKDGNTPAIDRNRRATHGNRPATDGNRPAIEGNVPAIEGNVPVIERNVPTIEGNVPTEEGNVPTIEGNIPATEGIVPAIEGNVPTLEGNIPTIEGYIPAIEGNVTAIEENIPAIEGNVPAIEGSIPAIEGNVPAVEGDVLAMEGNVPAIERNVPAVERNVPTIQGNVPTIEGNVPEIDDMYRLCTTRSYKDDFARRLTVVLNKYAHSDYQFTLEMTKLLLKKILGPNMELRQGVLSVPRILNYLKIALQKYKATVRHNPPKIFLASRHCLTVHIPGCYCKQGYVEFTSQCITPRECLQASDYGEKVDMYLSRLTFG